MHVHHAGERLGWRFAPTKILAVARISGDEDVVLQPVFFVRRKAERGPRGAMNHVAFGDIPVPARGDHHLDDVLNLLDRRYAILDFAMHRVHYELRDRQHFREIGKAQSETRRCIVGKRIRRVVMTRREKRECNRARDTLRVPGNRTSVALDDGVSGDGGWCGFVRGERERRWRECSSHAKYRSEVRTRVAHTPEDHPHDRSTTTALSRNEKSPLQ